MISKNLKHGEFKGALKLIPYEKIDKEHVMHSKSDNIEVMAAVKADEELFESLLSRYQIWSRTSMISSNFIFDSVYLLH